MANTTSNIMFTRQETTQVVYVLILFSDLLIYFMCRHTSLHELKCAACMQETSEARNGTGFLGTGVIGACETYRCWELTRSSTRAGNPFNLQVISSPQLRRILNKKDITLVPFPHPTKKKTNCEGERPVREEKMHSHIL